MDLYEYECPKCRASFEVVRDSKECDDDTQCPVCKHMGKMNRHAALFSKPKKPAGPDSCGSCCGKKMK